MKENTKFKVGDRVKIIDSIYINPKLQEGNTGTVREVEDVFVGLDIDNFGPPINGHYWKFANEELEKKWRKNRMNKYQEALDEIKTFHIELEWQNYFVLYDGRYTLNFCDYFFLAGIVSILIIPKNKKIQIGEKKR